MSAFLLVSVCAHAALLFYVSAIPPARRDVAAPLSVSLRFTEPVARAKPASPIPRTKRMTPATIPKDVPTPDIADVVREIRREQTNTVTDTEPARATEARPPNEEVREQMQAIVRLDLQRYFADSYPPIAQRRGWEGTVSLGATIQPDGTLSDVHVIASSGYDMLDRSAVATMKRIERLPEARPILGGRALELSLPVVYRLQN